MFWEKLSIAAPHATTRDKGDGALSPSIPGDINTYELGNSSDPAWIAMLTNVTNGLPVYFRGDQEELYPVVEDSNVTVADQNRRTPLNRPDTHFPGIYRANAYPDNDQASCTFAQLNVLEFAARVAVRLSYYNPTVLEDEPFQRYIVTDGRVNGRWSNGEARSPYLNLINNLNQVASFPSVGPKGHTLRKYRVTYQCGRAVGDVDNCANPGVAAYTVNPMVSGYGWTTIFCDRFFQLRFTDMLTYNNKQPITILKSQNPEYNTAEHTVMHEWMHAQAMGFYKYITDIGNPKVYGSQVTHDRAWLNMNPGNEYPNTEIVYNADNYAWTWTSREFARAWGWTDDDFRSIESVNANPFTTADIWTNLTGPMEPPINCVDNGTVVDCAYIGMLYDEYLLDQGAACNCTNNVCTSNSPACCSTSTCPSCTNIAANVNLTDLGTVPSCYLTNTCLWESQGGVLPPSISTLSPQSPLTTASSTSPIQTTPPVTGTCDCNEDECTPDSPPFCADGSCSN